MPNFVLLIPRDEPAARLPYTPIPSSPLNPTTMKYALPSCLLAFSLALGTSCSDGDEGGLWIGDDSSTAAEALTGSYTRVLAVGDFLYAVDTRAVITYDLSDRDNPVEVDRTDVGLAVETIYHLNGNLFIGSREAMFTYTIADDGRPVRRGQFDYTRVTAGVQPCDPVVADESTAYATLYTIGEDDVCGRRGDVQMLVVMDIRDLDNPSLITTYGVTTPRGLSLDGDLLFVCNDRSGVTVLDVSDPANPTEVNRQRGLMAWDVIADDGLLIVVGTDEVVQYDYSDPTRLVELSRLPYSRS